MQAPAGLPEKPKTADANAKKDPKAAPKKNGPCDLFWICSHSVEPAAPAPAKSETSVPVEFADVAKRRPKLRDQQPSSLSGKGDEPEDGPDLYIVLKDFTNATTLQYLIEEAKFKVDVMMFIQDFPKSNEQGKIASSTEQLKTERNTGAIKLKENKLTSPNSTIWSQLAWCEVSGKAAKHHFEMFDSIAQRIYSILDLRKLHSRITTNNVLSVPKVNPKDFKHIDLQCPVGVTENIIPYNLFAILEKVQQNTSAPTKNDKNGPRSASNKADPVSDIVENVMKSLKIDFQKNQIPTYVFLCYLIFNQQWIPISSRRRYGSRQKGIKRQYLEAFHQFQREWFAGYLGEIQELLEGQDLQHFDPSIQAFS